MFNENAPSWSNLFSTAFLSNFSAIYARIGRALGSRALNLSARREGNSYAPIHGRENLIRVGANRNKGYHGGLIAQISYAHRPA